MKPVQLALGAVAVALAGTAADAARLQISITNLSPTGGLSLTPLYASFHNGSVDLFDAGGSASAGLELLAELGNPSGLAAERAAIQPDSQGLGGIAAAGNGVPTVDPGETASAQLTITDPALNRFFSFFSMIVPSNDTFIAGDDPFELFDASGAFNGPFSFDVTAASVYDAGTEDNDLSNGPAFVVGQDGTAGATTTDAIALSTGIGDIPAGLTTPVGALDPVLAAAFVNDPSFVLARIEVQAVPLPATALLLLSGLGFLGINRARRSAIG